MTVHSRILERRREVAEDRAKRSVGRLLRMLAVVVPVAVLAWVAFSPWLSVSSVGVEGAGSAAAYEILSRHRVVVGTPMILIDVTEAEASLESDPWVSEAKVTLHWPDEVTVAIVEHEPLAWVQTAEGWQRRSVDGSALPSPETPDSSLPSVVIPEMGSTAAAGSREMLGALEWIDALPLRLRNGVVVRAQGGELWADLLGHRVRLGRPVEMTAKAMSLTSLLAQQLPAGAEINLVAPTHPAVGESPAGADDMSEQP